MKFDNKILDELVIQILAQHSFEFTSFSSAKATINIPGVMPIKYTLDR